MTQPWDRLRRESAPAREAFLTYRDMGADRSTAKVARALGKTKQLMDGWSSRNDWVDRAAAWDAHLEAILQQRQEEAIGEMGRRHAKLARALQDVPTPLLEELARRAKAGDLDKELKALPADELLDTLSRVGRTVKVGVDVERVAAGVPTDRIGVEVSPLSKETREKLKHLFGDDAP